MALYHSGRHFEEGVGRGPVGPAPIKVKVILFKTVLLT
jgi:hypothetical protein